MPPSIPAQLPIRFIYRFSTDKEWRS
jgi:hypothetical protein